jgi:hypothetical protein
MSIGDPPMPCPEGYDMDDKLELVLNIWILQEVDRSGVDRSWAEHGSD